MPHRDIDSQRTVHEQAHAASEVVGLLDLLWQQARDTVTTTSLSTPQLRLMYLVERNDGIRMRALGKLLHTAPPSVSRLCDRLQVAGFIERLPSPDSRREVTLRLTAGGKRHLEQIRYEREATLTLAIEAMPQEDRRALATGLAALQTAITAPR
ncbi:MarR family winged helix-turn-helix transcriptional regulator [Streptomyces sp. NBC_00083]|uniref:MarR family winged helix-turn-helix transcriptional regulator n=1 Tax=Streptomyces sp. NBC_00083 TaxID=2975647 RepID=UPI00224F013E|nr:MarR family transcriptional regulator [Streptomyces sp. NBC_00083]MCX5384477.1 MarR family transcriptional regulator [Streptomyces sp. NBC_00083]